MEFNPFPKIYRYSREVIVTEKIDGTNAQIYFTDDGQMFVGSRNKWITPEQDNYGFAKWAHANEAELRKLGPGAHFGEWWGAGIQRSYGLKEKRFSLFNVSRWSDPAVRPACCSVVPELWRGKLDDLDANRIIGNLRETGSVAAPGFMRPEGIVVYHVAGGVSFKKTCEKDDQHKGEAA
jgi:hypothetical protein